jgi:hypothetical protein
VGLKEDARLAGERLPKEKWIRSREAAPPLGFCIYPQSELAKPLLDQPMGELLAFRFLYQLPLPALSNLARLVPDADPGTKLGSRAWRPLAVPC